MAELRVTTNAAPAPAESMHSEGQFGVGSLLLFMTAAAVALAAVRAWGWVTSVPIFVAAVAGTFWIYPWIKPGQIAAQKRFFDAVWGLLMPIVCLALDPLLFKSDQTDLMNGSPWLDHSSGFGQLNAAALVGYPLFAIQITLLALWLLAATRLRRWASFFAGVFAVGMCAAGALSIILSPVAFIGCFLYGVGLPGFTPIFTTFSYARRCEQARAFAADDHPRRRRLGFLAGVLASILVPCSAFFARRLFGL